MDEPLINPDYRSFSFVINKTPELTKRQLDYWVRRGWIAAWDQAPGSGNMRWFHREEVPVIQYMNVLVNRMGLDPEKASQFAVKAAEGTVVSNKRGEKVVWLEDNGIVIGLPYMEEA